MRNEAERVIESLDETFRIGREVGVPVVISHHKVNGVPNHGRSPRDAGAHRASTCATQPIGAGLLSLHRGSTMLSRRPRRGCRRACIVTWSKPHPEYAGRDLDEIAAKMGVPQDEAVAPPAARRRASTSRWTRPTCSASSPSSRR